MANYTAADVKALREATGSGMLDCKKALEESNGDYDKAVEYLRIKGAKNVSKRAEREATEGLIAVSGNTMVEINCETDFVAKNEAFKAFATKIAEAAGEAKVNSGEELNTWRSTARRSLRSLTKSPQRPARSCRPAAQSPSRATTLLSTCTSVPLTCRRQWVSWSPTRATQKALTQWHCRLRL